MNHNNCVYRWIARLMGVVTIALFLATRVMAADPLPAPGQSATQLPDGRWLLLGGEVASSAVAQLFDPTTGQSAPTASAPNNARAFHTTTVLPDGRVLILGGLGADGSIVRVAEVFDLTTQAFTVLSETGLLPRARHTATVLMDGRVLVAGGVTEQGELLAESELWDPVTGQPDSGGIRLINPRMGHTATTLPSEPVLLSGGRGEAGAGVSASELYIPQQKEFIAAQGGEASSAAAAVPALQATLPESGASDVALDARIAVRFSKPLRVQSLTTQTVTVFGPNGPVAVQVTPAEAGMLLFVTPRVHLSPAASYTLFIAGAADPLGLALPFTAISFNTRSLGAGAATTQSSAASGTNTGTSSAQQSADGAASSTSTPSSSAPDSAAQTAETPGSNSEAEVWIPGPAQMRGDWRSKRPESELQKLPPLAAAPGITALAGQVLLLNGKPAVNVTLAIGGQSVRSGPDGRFLLQGILAGGQTLVIDGSSASQPARTYGYYEARISVEASKTNVLPYTIWLSQTNKQHAVSIPSPTTSEVVVTTPYIPGLELRIPKGTVLRDRAGRVVTQVSITPIPIDRPPFPLPTGYVPVYFTVQPGGAHLQGVDAASAQGARLLYPNYRNERPGTVMPFWNYDPFDKAWYVYGQGKVSADGKQVVPDTGVAIYEFTGAMISNPNLAPGLGPRPGGRLPHAGPRGLPGKGPGQPGRPPLGQPPGGLPPGGEPPEPPPDSCPRGDPVDCGTGLFLHTRTDLFLPDAMPIELTRTYRQGDTMWRPFGIGTNHIYGMFLVGDWFPYTYMELILPDGGRVRFNRISPGTSYADAVYASAGVSGAFAGAVLNWCSPNCAVAGSFWRITWKDGTQYFFPDSFGNNNPALGHITGIVDRYGNAITLTRNAAGNLNRITSPNGRWIELSHDDGNRITSATDSLGRVVSYTYDIWGRLATVTDPEGGVERYTYDGNDVNTYHRMLTVSKPSGQLMVTNVYDTNGRVSQQTLGDGGIYTFAYTLNASGKVTQTDVTDPRGKVQRLEFDSAGLLTKETRGLGTPEQTVSEIEREAQTNRALAMIDPLGRRTAYGYDAAGNMTSVTRLAGTTQAITTTFTFEPLFNRVASATNALGETMQFRYDGTGSLTEIQSPMGHVSTVTYDAAGRPLSVRDPLNNTTTLTYDAGDLQSATDPLGRTVTQFTDSVGRVIAVSDPLGNTTRFEYDRRDLATRHIDRMGNVTTMSYDANGNLLTVVDAKGGTWTHGYDAKDRVTSITNPLGKAESYAYDGTDNLTQLTQRNGKVSTFVHDALGRRIKAEHGRVLQGGSLTSPDATVDYTFDLGSRIVQVADTEGGTISRSFDGLNRLVQESTAKGTVTYSYDAGHRRQTMTAGSQAPSTYTYDNNSALLSITRGAVQVGFSYDAAGRPATTTLPNGIVGSYSYDAASQLTAITYALGTTTVGELSYQYDAAGHRTQVGGSLASTVLPQTVASATYNAANQLATWAGTARSYDDNGNLASDGQRTYTYDSRNRLKTISGAATASFGYDAIGRRIDRTVAGIGTGYLYDGANAVLELSGSTVKAELLTGLGIDQVLARTDAAGTKSLLTDALGSTLALADPSGVLQSSYSYEPYGQTTPSGAASDNSVQYTGRENDGTGLYFYRARYYDPAKGRFTQTDPIGLAAGINTYAYVEGDPVSYVDPAGLWSFSFGGFAGIGGIVTFGQNPNGSGFISGQFGWGLGGGFTYNPLGQQPGYEECQGASWGAGAGVYGQASFRAGPIGATIGANLGRNYRTSGSAGYGGVYTSGGLRDRAWGLNATASAGGQFTVFGGGTATGGCTCGS